MIYTVTLNPSIDYVVHLKELTPDCVNRTTKEEYLAGGKGINVSVVLHNLGVESTALGFVAGFTGREIVRMLDEQGILTDFTTVSKGMSRINVKIKTGLETEINGQGPVFTLGLMQELYDKICKLSSEDMVVLAGSIPRGLPDTLYSDLLTVLEDKKILTVVDATGNLLKNTLKHHPFLIKPNNHELSEIFGVTIEGRDDIIYYARELQKLGAKNVLVSMAGQGAILLTETNEVLECKAPTGKVINSVGAGDSMVAGFIAGYMSTRDYEQALRLGIAAGSASAFSDALAAKSQVEELLTQLKNND